jgi:hypothetical protein
MKRETVVAGCSACDRGSGRAPGKRIQPQSGKDLEWLAVSGDKAQLDNRIHGLGGAKQTTKPQRRKDHNADMLGYSDAVIVTRVNVKAGVGSGPRVVSSATPAPSARDAMPRFGHSREGGRQAAPHKPPNHDRLGRAALNRRFLGALGRCSRRATGVTGRRNIFWPVAKPFGRLLCFFLRVSIIQFNSNADKHELEAVCSAADQLLWRACPLTNGIAASWVPLIPPQWTGVTLNAFIHS